MTPGLDLVVGGAGFIGSELVGQLVAAGRRVVVLDNLATGSRERLDGVPSQSVRLVVGSILDRDAVAPLVAEAERVFNLACVGLRHSIHDPAAAHEVNATGAFLLLEAVRNTRVVRLIHVSSAEVYGTAEQAPMDENHSTRPTTIYGASKLAGEAYVRAYHRTYGLPAVILRPFNAYGPNGDSGEAIPRFMLRAMAGRPLVLFGDGSQTRDFTYFRDTARGMLLAAASDGAIGETVNLGSGREVAIGDLARRISDLAASGRAQVKHDAPRPGNVSRLVADSRKADRLFGWRAQVDLAEGLASVHKWYLSRGETPEELIGDDIARNWEAPQAPR
jgi:UDP-glucose 4-epimerase